jgi:hypothetical protein
MMSHASTTVVYVYFRMLAALHRCTKVPENSEKVRAAAIDACKLVFVCVVGHYVALKSGLVS